MDRIKSQLTEALISVDKARNHYRDHGCDAQLPRLVTEAYVAIDAARNATLDRARYTKRPAYLPADDHGGLIPTAGDCAGCTPHGGRDYHPEHTCGFLGSVDV